MAKVIAVCVSEKKGTAKRDIGRGEFIARHGLKGDAHAGGAHTSGAHMSEGHRQVSLLSLEKIDEFRAKGAEVQNGAFGENLVVQGIDFRSLPLGTMLRCGDVVLEITQIGKECHSHCAIYEQTGDCIMPREGVFAKVVRSGIIKTGDEMTVSVPYRAAIITVSDKGWRGEREDTSGPLLREIAEAAGYTVTHSVILPDEQELLEREMRRICDEEAAELLLTTGGTGFSPRDRTPEATLAVAERLAPGIAEAMRCKSMAITGRAMLNRGVSVIRNKTLIINLPGSPKAVKECLECIIGDLKHGLDILSGRDGECGLTT
jgi:molybdenum cofactor synthesis domain-containing protein